MKGKLSTTSRKKKTPQKVPLSISERLKRLFTSLCAQIDGAHFTNASKTCDKSAFFNPATRVNVFICVACDGTVLRLDPRDKDALQTKLFLLLQTEQYAAALALVDTSDGIDGAFDRAYSLYRLQHKEEATEMLKGIKESTSGGEENRGVLHLEAQLVSMALRFVPFPTLNVRSAIARGHIRRHSTSTRIFWTPQSP